MTSLPMLSDWHQTVYVYHRTRRQWQRCREEFDAFLECGILVLLLISNARNSVSMFFEPSAHFVISPSPFNRLGVAVVVFGPCRHDVLNELVPTVP